MWQRKYGILIKTSKGVVWPLAFLREWLCILAGFSAEKTRLVWWLVLKGLWQLFSCSDWDYYQLNLLNTSQTSLVKLWNHQKPATTKKEVDYLGNSWLNGFWITCFQKDFDIFSCHVKCHISMEPLRRQSDGKNMRLEEKWYFNAFEFTRKSIAFPKETLLPHKSIEIKVFFFSSYYFHH